MNRIGGLSIGAVASQGQTLRLLDMRTQLADLNRQLATGKRADTHARLGASRATALDFSAHVAAQDTFGQTATRGAQRLALMTGTVERLGSLAQTARADLAQSAGITTSAGVASAARAGFSRLGEALALLNTDFDGQYLFSGRASSTRPVVDPGVLLDGDGAKAGLRVLTDERRQADIGNGNGRLASALAGTTVTVSEESAGLPFGFKLAGLAGTFSGATLAAPAGSPAVLSLTLGGQPADGERVQIDLDLPDGSRETLVLSARTLGSVALEDGSFLIGADPTATAANLKAALDLALTARAATALAAASSIVAAQDLADGSTGTPARRIAGPPFATATAFAAPGSRPTVTWYAGDDDPAGDARASQLATVDRGLTLGVGARADEPAIGRAIAGLAALAAEAPSGGDAIASARYQALGARAALQFGGPQQGQELKDITIELSSAAGMMGEAQARSTTRKAFYEAALSDIQTPSIEELSAAILALQTRLQASYQTTASLARLNLSDYLR